MCYYIIQISLRLHVILTSLVPRLHLQRFGRWSLGTIPGTFAVTDRASARNGRLDFHDVTVSRAMAPERSSARSSARCVIARACGVPRTQDAYGLQRADIARVLSVALSYVASSLVATPKNQRKPDSASLRSNAISHVV